MRLTLLSHSTLLLEHRGTSVLIDPWLVGDAYGGAWQLLPEVSDALATLPRPDWILFSHGHPDHFHLPTLEALAARFGRDLRLLLPRQALPHLRNAALAAGFRHLHEVTLQTSFALGDDFAVRITAARADDSVQVFRAGGRLVVNANDCRVDENLRRAIAVQEPDLFLGQFAAADAYPFALEGLDDAELRAAAARPAHLLCEEARALGARAVIPIGGFVRFAHVENQWMNRWRTDLDSLRSLDEPRLEILCPGDGWDEADGFRREPANRSAYENAERAWRDGALPLRSAPPAPPRAEIEGAASSGFGKLFAALPAVVRRRIGRLGFDLEDEGGSLVVDFAARRLDWSRTAPEAPHYVLGAAHFTETCLSPWGWSDFHIAARFRVRRWRDSPAIQTFLPASILGELGYLGASPLELLRPRALRAFWSRRQEIAALFARLARGDAMSSGPFRRL